MKTYTRANWTQGTVKLAEKRREYIDEAENMGYHCVSESVHIHNTGAKDGRDWWYFLYMVFSNTKTWEDI